MVSQRYELYVVTFNGIHFSKEYFPSEVDESAINSFRNVVKALQKLGVEIVPVSLPTTPYALSAYYVIASAEASSNLARYNGIHYGIELPLECYLHDYKLLII